MPITVIALLMGIEALWDNQMEMIFRPGHRDVDSVPLFGIERSEISLGHWFPGPNH
ncbi:MAG: hypothetical protein WAK55_14620 [Xanthobacteraceae bacterium]